MLGKLIDYIIGTVDFYAEGTESEKFLSYCNKNGIEIINPRKTGYVFFGKVHAKDYKRLRTPGRRCGLRLKIQNKKGLYFFLRKNRAKAGFAVGLLFIIAFIAIMNLFIWEINVIGNSKISEKDIISYANETGLFIGSLAYKHSAQDIEWYIMNKNEGLATVEVNIQGSCANILINETFEKPEMKPDDDVPVNIVASRYGVIKNIEVFDGQKAVEIGEAVMKGDLLVSAVYEDRHNKLTLKHARANVIAETDYILNVEFPLTQTVKTKGNLEKTIYDFEILGFDFRIGNINNKNYFKETEEKELSFFWIKLPINLKITRFYNVKVDSITYNFGQGRAGAFALLEENEHNKMNDIEIISRTVDEKVKNNKYILNANYICLMNIAEEQPIESDIPWKNTDDMS